MYDPYSKGLKCKWCGIKIMDHAHDLQCDGCWEFLHRLDHALKNPKLLTIVKKKLAVRKYVADNLEHDKLEKGHFVKVDFVLQLINKWENDE